MIAAGAAIVFPENFAAGLALADQVLLLGGLTRENAAKVVTTVRAELSPELIDRVGLLGEIHGVDLAMKHPEIHGEKRENG
jgi:monovalent cation:H+ antiporter-2, CPA2 family